MRGSIHIGRVLGIPVSIHYSWFLIFALVTVSFALVTYPYMFPEEGRLFYWGAGAITSLLLFVSVLLHELAHSLVSEARGMPVEGITLFILGGVSTISKDSTDPRDELVMAGAGPLTSLALGLLFGGSAFLLPAGSFARGLATILGSVNITLAIFNMIPGFPLDGGRVLRALIWWGTKNGRLATRIASTSGRVIAMLMIVGGLGLALFLGNWPSGIWLVFIGWFLDNAANQGYRQFMLKDALEGMTAGDLMGAGCARLDGNPDVESLVEDRLLAGAQPCLMVTSGDTPAGLITLQNVKNIPRHEWSRLSAHDIMTPLQVAHRVQSDAPALDVLRIMDDDDLSHVPVTEDGLVVGTVNRDRILTLLRERMDNKN